MVVSVSLARCGGAAWYYDAPAVPCPPCPATRICIGPISLSLPRPYSANSRISRLSYSALAPPAGAYLGTQILEEKT